MIAMECVVKCPWCLSETKILLERANPIIFHCSGCSRNVVIHGSVVYTVSDEFLEKILSSYRIKPCGKILGSQVSDAARDMDDRTRMGRLHELLQQNIDVADFIKKLP